MKPIMTFALAAAALAMPFGTLLAQETPMPEPAPSTTAPPPPPTSTSAPSDPPATVTPPPATSGNVLEVAKGAGQFSTLLAAIEAAGLSATLAGPGPYTVFAPTDAAFAKLPAGTVERLLMPENRAELSAILTYHVTPSRVPSGNVTGKTGVVDTVNGATLAIDGLQGVKVNTANVVQADVNANNGVIHVIDAVLMPPKKEKSKNTRR